MLIVGTHPQSNQRSMKMFARWLGDALAPVAAVETACAPSFFLNSRTKTSRLAKWLAHLDQYALLTAFLMVRAARFDCVIFADHANAPAGLLVGGRKIAVMVHDTIAMRQARGELAFAPPMGASGRMLQHLTRIALARARLLYTNPGKVPDELAALGVPAPCLVLGCQVDLGRLSNSSPKAVLQGRYILNVGGSGWRKRKPELLQLWRRVQALDGTLQLVLAGRTSVEERALITDWRLERVVILDDLEDGALARLYQDAEALVAPSLYEGLCIPIIEAGHFGKRIFVAEGADYTSIFGAYVQPLDFDVPEAAAKTLLSTLAEPRLDVGLDVTWYGKANFDGRVLKGLYDFLISTQPEAAR